VKETDDNQEGTTGETQHGKEDEQEEKTGQDIVPTIHHFWICLRILSC